MKKKHKHKSYSQKEETQKLLGAKTGIKKKHVTHNTVIFLAYGRSVAV